MGQRRRCVGPAPLSFGKRFTPTARNGLRVEFGGGRRPVRGARYLRRIARDDLTLPEFQRLVDEALDALPKRFSDLVRNVVIAVEDEPSADDLDALEDDDPHAELLGIYRGVALTERTHNEPLLPDEIAIFRGPILRVSRTRSEAREQIRETVIHELGHYFGLADEEMHY